MGYKNCYYCFSFDVFALNAYFSVIQQLWLNPLLLFEKLDYLLVTMEKKVVIEVSSLLWKSQIFSPRISKFCTLYLELGLYSIL